MGNNNTSNKPLPPRLEKKKFCSLDKKTMKLATIFLAIFLSLAVLAKPHDADLDVHNKLHKLRKFPARAAEGRPGNKQADDGKGCFPWGKCGRRQDKEQANADFDVHNKLHKLRKLPDRTAEGRPGNKQAGPTHRRGWGA